MIYEQNTDKHTSRTMVHAVPVGLILVAVVIAAVAALTVVDHLLPTLTPCPVFIYR